jgi:hypothetical protein
MPDGHPEDSGIADNLRGHNSAEIKEAAEAVGAHIRYLPHILPISIPSNNCLPNLMHYCAQPPRTPWTGAGIKPVGCLTASPRRTHRLFHMAVSSSQCNGCMLAPVRRDFQGRGKIEAFAGTRGAARGEGVQLPLRVPRHVRPLGQVRAPPPLRVFSGAARARAGVTSCRPHGHSVPPSPPSEPGAPGVWCAPPGCRPPSQCARP